jgi:CO/xanthine dehydrogenase Mo-binding subunit
MDEAPGIEGRVIKRKQPVGGIEEVGSPSIAPAGANAVINPSGIRVRRLPMSPHKVRESAKKK